MIIIVLMGLTSCFGEPRHHIEGLTDEIYRVCSGLWTIEKYIRNENVTGPANVSWEGEAFANKGSLLIDFKTSTEYEIWPDVEPLVVKKVKKVDDSTIKIIVSRPRSYMSEKGEWIPYEDTTIIMHLLNDHRMWIDSKISDKKGDGSIIDFTGPDYIYKKVSGPDIKPLFTEKSDEKELMTPP